VAPDCGLKYMPRSVAFEKMKAMVEGGKLVRSTLQGHGRLPKLVCKGTIQGQ
jgi:hypothetical protein